MKLVPIIALAVLVATPAFAANAMKKKPSMLPQSYFQQESDWRSSHNQYRAGGSYLGGPSVYSPSGRYVGRDPSASVRQRLYDDDLRFRGRP